MYKHLKRFFDLFILVIGLFFLIPIFIVLFIVQYYIYGKSEIFFKQERIGYNENPFELIKFKSMTDKKDSKGKLLPNEQRITPVGAFLRKFSLDELPQLFNVIRGDMSLIGPRPLPVKYLPLYSQKQKQRHLVKPGITGWAQVNGRNAISWTKKFELDVWYVQNISFTLDLKILFLTFKQVISHQGIDSKNRVGSERFNGKN